MKIKIDACVSCAPQLLIKGGKQLMPVLQISSNSCDGGVAIFFII